MLENHDIIKNSMWDNMAVSDVTTTEVVFVLAMTGVLGIFIYGVYRAVTRKAFYSRSFNISLVAIALITAAIIIAIQSSVVISLGMVGALSIVRFRTAVKDPMDLVFLFWAISVGIICGTGLFETAVWLSVAVAGVVLLLELVPVVKAPMVLVINSTNADVESEICSVVRKHTRIYRIKSRNLTKQGLDMVIELRIKGGGDLVEDLGKLDSLHSVSLISHDGEVNF